jgi:hypothetical protein
VMSLNVTGFTSPVYEQMSSSQVKAMAIHYPIKTTQPSLQFDVQFATEAEFESFQVFVRNHQQTAVGGGNLVTLNWPQRNILHWTGVIRSFKAGGMRFNVRPMARFVVDLVDSLVSSRTELASIASNWVSIYGLIGMPNGVLNEPGLTTVQAQEYGMTVASDGSLGSALQGLTSAPVSIPLTVGSMSGFAGSLLSAAGILTGS